MYDPDDEDDWDHDDEELDADPEDNIDIDNECAFPGACCMPGEHMRCECHTADMLEDYGFEDEDEEDNHILKSVLLSWLVAIFASFFFWMFVMLLILKVMK